MSRPANFDESEVLDKAVRLFWAKGYCDTTAQDLTEHLQLNRSSIYNTFKDKRTLFLRALQRYRERESAGMIAFLQSQPSHPDAVRLLLEHVVQASRTETACKGCLMVNTAAEMGARDAEARAIVQENVQEVVASFADFIRKGQRQGTFPPERDAESLAVALFHSVTALRVTTKVVDDPVFFQQYIAATLALFQCVEK